ncbi:MAG: ribonuclease J [Ruminococcaceae bacterium]|nr:ribonuclease J [Oscillospiraceae bacterium]
MPKKDKGKLRVIPLGGLNEIGKNMTVLEYGEDIIIIDCGLGFPDEDMPGIDLVIPDITYLEANRERIRGIVLTHGHEDHIGAIPYCLRQINPPVYGTKLTLGIIKNKLEEHVLPYEPSLNCVNAGQTVKLGAFSIEFIHVNHSIADACALAITTPLGTVVHSGDFKLDITPIDGEMMNITRLGEIGRRGVLLLMCESTNAERPGYTPSEKKVGKSLEYIFNTNADKRIVIATFSSNVHRVQQIINVSARHGRKVAITGRSMLNIIGAAVELGYMTVPDGVLVDINDIKRYKPEELTLVTTGSQGEPMSALYRMAFSDHSQVTLGRNDVVILSSSAIPGNEKLVGRIINELSKNGIGVLHDASLEVHVSGHACQEELKLLQALLKPKYFMPVHGEYRHLSANRELALDMGIEDRNIFISDIGKVLEIDVNGARYAGAVPAGKVLVDGYGVGDVGNIVLRDRRHLSQDGLIVVVASVDLDARLLLSEPDIISRGFVYVRESEELMEEIRALATEAITDRLERSDKADRMDLKTSVKDVLSKYLYNKTKRKPMVLPVIVNV